MAKIKLEFDAEPFTGQIVTFVAPCSCEEVTDGLVINGNTYAIVDAMGAAIKGSAWCAGALISVSLDVTNRRAFIQNPCSAPGNLHGTDELVDKTTPLADGVIYCMYE